jgi:hypothetical protein
MTCPHCHHAAEFKGYRAKTITSLMGPIRIERAYYHCAHCHTGIVPWDDILRLGQHEFTPGAEEVVSLAGCVESFTQAQNVLLSRMTGIVSSESTIQRTSEDAGQRIGDQLAAGEIFGPEEHWEFFQDVQGHTVGYISADATSVPQQGEHGESAEGRMPYVGMLYNPPPADWEGKSPDWQARYVCGLTTLDDLGLVLRRQAAQVGFDKVERWIGLTDGGNGLEEFLLRSFPKPKLQLILDFYHAAEHVNDFLKIYCGADEDRATELGQKWCHKLKHQGGRTFVKFLQTISIPARNKTLQEAYRCLVNYLNNNVHRMDYPKYQANGWHIGSGPVESACKTVVNRRLCGGGMRWRERGTDAICHLRALYRSETSQWSAFWNPAVT